MAEKKSMLTGEGLKKLQDELQDLEVVRLKEVAQKIKEAREQGDLSENAEYDAAREEQRDIVSRIDEIKEILKNVEVVDEDDIDIEKVNIGCTVTLYDKEFEEEVEYTLVGSTETDSINNKISNESPLGKELMGKTVGDEVVVETSYDKCEYKILKITRN
ncbi:MAG: transcription elongation factor GreA [Lachnospiraceae bacterium]|nr:transcription elongation factor GreA [Lachnospiraceae bacterium]